MDQTETFCPVLVYSAALCASSLCADLNNASLQHAQCKTYDHEGAYSLRFKQYILSVNHWAVPWLMHTDACVTLTLIQFANDYLLWASIFKLKCLIQP